MSTTAKQKIIIILGPTASGKSNFAVKLAKKFNGELISADSRQIYQELNIGSNKITETEKQGIKHYLLDVVKPDQEFSLYDWQQNAFQSIEKILKKNKQPIIVGGTGLYLSSILQNYQLPATDKTLRLKLNKLSLEKLVAQLKKIDPEITKKIDSKNKIHVVRALEYAIAFHDDLSANQKTSKCPYDYLILGLNPDKEKLYTKINQRVDSMMKIGLVEEVKNLLKKYKADLPALSGIGYQEISKYLNKELDLEEAVELIKKNTRHYAKRQMTWFRRMEKQGLKINWNKNITEAESLIKKFLN
ncbi:tRNA (adenosine(37)-N6)-dimethylallyltransferase MiaA [Patescibacteria group bacterium]|nr:tRNA (adenosine(37)-N6)-dimethylallyltransferase MiaA [Patescibacteria group bacterium]